MKKLLVIVSLLLVFISSCNTIQYRTETQRLLPELGTLGVFENYLIGDVHHVKSITDLEIPLRVKVEKVTQTQRALFQKKDSIAKPKEFLSLEIFDKFLLLEQLNQDKSLSGFLKKNPSVSVVSKVFVQFKPDTQQAIFGAEEVYLIHQKERTLSLQLRSGNTIQNVEFSQGNIIDFDAYSFCWGTKKGYKVEILDIVDGNSDCSKNTYKSYQRAKNKTEFSFQ